MKRAAAPRPRRRADRATRQRPAPAMTEGPATTPAGGPDQPDVQAAPVRGPTADDRSAQTDIERADERRLGSIETIPARAPEDHIAGFIEPAGDTRADEPLPPPWPSP